MKILAVKIFPIYILLIFAVSCFDGLGPLSVATKPDYTLNFAKSISLSVDHDIDENEISYNLQITKASDESRVGHYAIYWGDSEMNILNSAFDPIKTYAPTGGDIEDTINLPVPDGAVFILVYTKLTENNISKMSVSAAVEDLVMKRVSNINDFNTTDPDLFTYRNSNPESFVVYNNKLYFRANDISMQKELWSYDEDNGITGPHTDINPSGSSSVNSLVVFNNRIYFSAYDPDNGNELYYYDGDNSVLVEDHIPDTGSLYPSDLTVCGDMLFFSGDINSRTQLVGIDKDHNYTDIKINSYASSYPNSFFVYNNVLFFNANTASTALAGSAYQLFRYDGTLNTIDINGMNNPYPGSFVTFKGDLYFTAADSISGQELWKYNGISAELVSDIKPGSGTSLPGGLYVFNGRLYLAADDGKGDGKELWFYDGETFGHFNLVPNSSSMPGSYPSTAKCEFNGYLFFTAYTGTTDYELWVYRNSGMPEMITDLNPGTNSCSIDEYIVYNNKLYFSTDDNSGFGRELWVLYFK